MKKISKLLITLILAGAMSIGAFAFAACGGDDVVNTQPGQGADVDLGSRRGELTVTRAMELLTDWVETAEEGGLTDMTVSLKDRMSEMEIAFRGDEVIGRNVGAEGTFYYGRISSIYVRDGVQYEREYHEGVTTRFVSFGDPIHDDMHWLIAPWELRMFAGGYYDDLETLIKYYEDEFSFEGHSYARGYRISLKFSWSYYIYDEDFTLLRRYNFAFDNNGRLVGMTAVDPRFTWCYDTYEDIIEERTTTLNIDWRRPSLTFPGDLDAFIRPSADIISGINYSATEQGTVNGWGNIGAWAGFEQSENTHRSWSAVDFEFSGAEVDVRHSGASWVSIRFLQAGTVTVTVRSRVNPAVYETITITVVA